MKKIIQLNKNDKLNIRAWFWYIHSQNVFHMHILDGLILLIYSIGYRIQIRNGHFAVLQSHTHGYRCCQDKTFDEIASMLFWDLMLTLSPLPPIATIDSNLKYGFHSMSYYHTLRLWIQLVSGSDNGYQMSKIRNWEQCLMLNLVYLQNNGVCLFCAIDITCLTSFLYVFNA